MLQKIKIINYKDRIIAFVLSFFLMIVLAYIFKIGLSQIYEQGIGNIANPSQGKIRIVASFYSLAEFAKNVGGNYADVINITPAGAEPHDYEPTPQDIAKIYDAKLFIFNGNGVDNWADKIQNDLQSKGIAVVKISDHMDSFKNNSLDQRENKADPHFWLDPINAEKETDLIADALIQIDPARQEEYDQNRDNFKNQLALLDREYKTGLADCRLHTIVASHNAFNYLARRYNFDVLYILGLTPDQEPSPQTIAQTANLAKEKGIKHIFFETLVSPKLSETIANEIGAKILVLNPIEGLTNKEISAGKNYISVMKDNLNNLRTALSCQ